MHLIQSVIPNKLFSYKIKKVWSFCCHDKYFLISNYSSLPYMGNFDGHWYINLRKSVTSSKIFWNLYN